MKLFAILSLTLALTGCMPVSSQQGSDLSKLPDFRIDKGKTTEAELVKNFGKAQTTVTNGDGTKTLVWHETQAKGHVNLAAALIPFMWTATKTSEHKTQSRSLTVTTRDGVVVDYRVTDQQGQVAF